MERIHYAGDSVLTGTAIARALLEYANALARHQLSATVDIPVLLPDGSVGRANFLVGPASQLVSEAEDSGFPELTDPELIEQLSGEVRRLQPAHPVAEERSDGDEDLLDDL